jgi:hypothetical protein
MENGQELKSGQDPVLSPLGHVRPQFHLPLKKGKILLWPALTISRVSARNEFEGFKKFFLCFFKSGSSPLMSFKHLRMINAIGGMGG